MRRVYQSEICEEIYNPQQRDGDEISNTEVLVDLMFLGTTYLVRFIAEFNLL